MPDRFHRALSAGSDIEVTYPTPDDPTAHPLHADGDELDAAPLGGAWTKRNVAQTETLVAGTVVGRTAGVSLNFDAQGDGVFRAAPAGDWEIVASLSGPAAMGASSPMISLCALDAAGTGVGLSFYDAGAHRWTITTYAYSATAATVATTLPGSAEYWLALKKVGTTYSGRVSINGTAWTAIPGTATGPTPTQVGMIRAFAGSDAGVFTLYRFNVYPSPGYYT